MPPDHNCHHEKKKMGIMYTKCTKTVLINIFAKQNKNGGEEPLPDINKNLPDSKEATSFQLNTWQHCCFGLSNFELENS